MRQLKQLRKNKLPVLWEAYCLCVFEIISVDVKKKYPRSTFFFPQDVITSYYVFVGDALAAQVSLHVLYI